MSKPDIDIEQVIALRSQGVGKKRIKKQFRIGLGRINKADEIRAERARKGQIPEWGMGDHYADGLRMAKVTVHKRHVDGVGEVVNTWERAVEDRERLDEMLAALTESMANKLPKAQPVPSPDVEFDADIIPWLQIGDAHIGLACHESQVNHHFDLEMARRELCAAFADLIDRSRPCERFVINDLGDATHYENGGPVAMTAASGNLLQSSGTYAEMIAVYDTCLRFAIDYALRKHKHVDVIINQGNHSRTNDLTMAHMLRVHYQDEPRVTVLDNRCILIPYRMGNTFVVTTHTDKMKPKAAADAIATDYHQDWGEAFYRYIDGGHIHHHTIGKEHSGVVYRSWNQLAPNDKHAYEAGYRSRSFLSLVERSKTYGERGTLTVTAEEIKDRLDGLAPGTTAQRRLPVHTV